MRTERSSLRPTSGWRVMSSAIARSSLSMSSPSRAPPAARASRAGAPIGSREAGDELRQGERALEIAHAAEHLGRGAPVSGGLLTAGAPGNGGHGGQGGQGGKAHRRPRSGGCELPLVARRILRAAPGGRHLSRLTSHSQVGGAHWAMLLTARYSASAAPCYGAGAPLCRRRMLSPLSAR